MKCINNSFQAVFFFGLFWLVLAAALPAVAENHLAINPGHETGYFEDFGKPDLQPTDDDFEWFMPIHLGPREAWEKPAHEGEITFRATKIETNLNGSAASIYCKAFLFDKNMRSLKPVCVEIRYKDVLPAPAVVSAYCRVAPGRDWDEIGRLEGKNDGAWKTAKLEIPPGNLLADKDENYVLKIDTSGTGGSFVVDWVKMHTNVPSAAGTGEGETGAMGFETEGFWGFAHYPARHDYEVYFDETIKHGGVRSLALKNVDKASTVSWGGCFSRNRMPATEKTVYRITFYAKAEDSSDSRLQVYFGGQPAKQMEVFPMPEGTYDWRKMQFALITPAQTCNLRLYFMKGEGGKTWIDDAQLEKTAEGEYQTMTRGKNTYVILPRAEQADPALDENIKKINEKTGYIVYARENPRSFYPDSIPQPGEITGGLKTFACPGQYASVWFMIHALKNIESVRVAFASDLVRDGGDYAVKRGDITIKHITFWLRKRYALGLAAQIIPEMLKKNQPVNILPGKNEGFWLQLKIPEDAPAGKYSSKISVNCANAPETTIAFDMEILPFQLEKPSAINWAAWSDLSERYKDKHHVYTDEELVKYLQDMKDYGITAIFDHTYNNFEATARTARLFKTMGFKGPLALLHWPDAYAMKKRGKEWKYGVMYPEMKNPDFQQDAIDYLKALDVVVKNAGVQEWYLHPYGELNYDAGGWFERAEWMSQIAGRAGTRLWLTLYPLAPLQKLCPHLSGAINVMATLGGRAKTREIYHDLAEKYNFTLYSLCGTYTGQEGGLMPDRYYSGFQLYKSGARGCAVWTWQRPGMIPRGKKTWAESDGLEVDTCMAYPALEISGREVQIPTLQLEGVREGVDDYCHVYTLEQWIKRADEKGLVRDAETAREKLEEIIASIPWGKERSAGNSYSQPGNFNNAKARECRRQIADEIIKLKQLVK
ncbi:MAG: hypothetical protein PHP98_09275 [Kiritimatiellae bacterium]|nr:hypothetical protein [Kiritimatiellia bacterium]